MKTTVKLRHLIIILLGFLSIGFNAKAADVYWKPTNGSDSNSGTSANYAVKSFETAKSKVSSASDKILLCETYSITSSVTLDGSKGRYNVMVTRVGEGSPNYMFDIGPGITVTLKNITISGGFPEDVHTTEKKSTYGNSIIYFSADGTSYVLSTLNIGPGTVIKDGWSNYGGAIKMYRGNIINMTGGEIYNCGGTNTGGAIYLSAYKDTNAEFNMSGGTIRHCRSSQGGGAVSFSNFENASETSSFSTFGHITFNMSGTATIEECIYAPLEDPDPLVAKYYGGGAVAIYQVAKPTSGSHIYVNQWKLNKFNMTGGTISDCHANGTNGFGGAIFVDNQDDDEATPVIISGSAIIEGCDSEKENGGGIYMRGLTSFSMNGGTIKDCESKAGNGGGVYITGTRSSSYSMTNGAVISQCTAQSNGGGVYLDKKITSCIFNGVAEISSCSSNGSGGAMYVASASPTPTTDSIVVELKSVKIYGNEGTSGGGIDMERTKIIVGNGAELYDNIAKTGNGGAINGYHSIFKINGGKIYNNSAPVAGGAIHASRCSFVMTGGEIHDNSCLGTGSIQGVGGAMHMSYCSSAGGAPCNGYVALKGGKFYGNTGRRGGAINFNTSTVVDIPATSTIEFYDNEANCGGALSIDGAQLIMAAGSFYRNKALTSIGCVPGEADHYEGKGGAILEFTANNSNTNPSLVSISAGNFYNNEAGTSGGAIYVKNVEKSGMSAHNKLQVQGGDFYFNSATEAGGAIYFEDEVELEIQGTVRVQNNMVNGVPNNIYLLSSENQFITVTGAFSPQYVGIYPETNATIGSPIEVFHGTSTLLSSLYDNLEGHQNIIVDDKQLHSATLPSPNDILYFSLDSPWSPLQQKVTGDDLSLVNGVYQIGSVKQLTAFLWLVNNIDTHANLDPNAQPTAKGKLTADIDMTGHYWVPIANYTGIFDGNGYVVSGLTMVPTNVETERGLFGVNISGTIKNVNLRDCYFAGGGSYIGSIVSQMNGGTLYNSVAQCQLLATATTTKAGGLVGHINGGEVHSSVSTCKMTGYTIGGLVGQLTSGNLYNSFANPQFNYSGPDGSTNYYVGGLVADNGTNGTVQNCYVRFRRTQTLTNALFGQLAGNNGGSITDCYTPLNYTSDVPATIVHTGSATSDTYKVADAPYKYNRPNDNKVGSTDETLTEKLNEWVSSQHSSHPDYAYWKRTTAGGYGTGGNINDDYPIHKMVGLSNAASPDGLFIEYKYSLDATLTKYNDLEDGGTVWVYDSPLSAMAASGGTPSYESVSVDNNATKVKLYIDEDASLLQAANNTLTAYTGQTLRNYAGNRWHNVSSSLKQSGIGFDYTNSQYALFNWSINPCNIALSGDDDNAFFPSDMPWPATAQMDFYCFYEPEYHWINLKRRTDSHWHMNATTVPIVYNGNGLNPAGGQADGNETYMVPGKGYLVSIDKDQLIQNKGELNNGTVTLYSVTKTDYNAWAGLLGYNLLGNPYQSYLDFEVFKTTNSGLWAGTNEYNQTYATFDPKQNAYRQYFPGVSSDAKTASQYIHPHQGFFIRKTADDNSTNTNTNTVVTFTNAMRTNTTNGQSGFRGAGQPRHALVNFVVRDAQGNGDIAVLELNRDGDEGAEKIRMGDGTGHLSLGYDGKAYAILFRTKVDGYQPLWFEATEAGTFTLGWDIHNAVFESLTLVDNIAGTSTDMLATDSYTFQGSPDHYTSRFKVVIGDYVEVDPDAPVEPVEGPTFAFQMGDQLVVNGAGTLQVFDVMGRQLSSTTLSGTRSTVGLPTAATGVYVLRLTSENGTKVQKIVFGN